MYDELHTPNHESVEQDVECEVFSKKSPDSKDIMDSIGINYFCFSSNIMGRYSSLYYNIFELRQHKNKQ